MNGLAIEKLYYRQGDFFLKDINVTLPEGSVTALTGRSGAGKSTLIRLIGNVLAPDAGRILYMGKELCEDEKTIRSFLSVIYDAPNVNPEIRAGRLAAEIRRIEPWFSMEMFEQYMEKVKLDPHRKLRSYSQGMIKTCMLILALCRRPKLLIMDELSSNADPVSVREMASLLAQYRTLQDVTILFSTHNPREVKRFAEQVILLSDGTVKFAGSTADYEKHGLLQGAEL